MVSPFTAANLSTSVSRLTSAARAGDAPGQLESASNITVRGARKYRRSPSALGSEAVRISAWASTRAPEHRGGHTVMQSTTPTTAAALVTQAKQHIENLTAEQVATEMTGNVVLVDLREPAELSQTGVIPGAVHAP